MLLHLTLIQNIFSNVLATEQDWYSLVIHNKHLLVQINHIYKVNKKMYLKVPNLSALAIAH